MISVNLLEIIKGTWYKFMLLAKLKKKKKIQMRFAHNIWFLWL